VDVSGACWIGIGAGVIGWMAVTALKTRFGYDDSLDAFGVHGLCGIWGSLAVGIWATTGVNANGVNGLLYGNPIQLWLQAKAVLITMVYSFGGSLLLLKIVDLVIPIRITEHEERVGLDLTQHRESGYTVID